MKQNERDLLFEMIYDLMDGCDPEYLKIFLTKYPQLLEPPQDEEYK